MNTAENFVDTLPQEIKNKFQEMYPLEKSSIETFLNRTKWCHDLHKWQASKIYDKKRFFSFLQKNQIDYSTFNSLKEITFKTSFKQIELKKPLKVRGKYYTKVLSTPPQQNKNYIYLDFMEIYLEE